MKIVAFSGSLRKGSYNTMLLQAFQKVAPEGTEIEILDIGNLPLYNGDLEAHYPAEAQKLKDAISGADGVIFATPEYNRSVSGVLKNMIDWVSRPYGQNALKGKPVLVAGVSSGKIGTAVAQSHLKQILTYLDTKHLGQPELYLGPAKELFDESGNLLQEGTKEVLISALTALAQRVGQG